MEFLDSVDRLGNRVGVVNLPVHGGRHGVLQAVGEGPEVDISQ